MTALLPDASPTNWVDRYAPAPMRPWLKLGRFDRPVGIWLLMLPGWQGIALAAMGRGQLPSPWLLLAFAAGAALMRSAGCAYNDIVDRDIDAQVARTAGRPIPSGQISLKQAWLFLALCGVGGLCILVTLNLWAVILGVASLALVAIYPFMKRITWWPQAWLGLTFNWGILMGFTAASGGVPLALWAVNGLGRQSHGYRWMADSPGPWGSPPSLAALLLYAGAVLWTIGYDTIYATQDLEDDALVGVKSSARRLGARAPAAVLGLYVAAFVLALAAAYAGHAQPLFWPVAALYGMQLSRQAQRFRTDDPALALAIFKSNGLAGLILFAALCAGSFHAGWMTLH